MNKLLSSSPRYLMVSAGCVLFNTALLIVLDRLGVHYSLAVVVSAAILIPLSYALHLKVTYHVDGGRSSLTRYAATQIVNTPLALVLFFLIHDRAGMAMVWAAPIVTGLMFVYNLTSSFWAIALRTPIRKAQQ